MSLKYKTKDLDKNEFYALKSTQIWSDFSFSHQTTDRDTKKWLNEILSMSNPKQFNRINRVDVIHNLFSNEISHLILTLFGRNV